MAERILASCSVLSDRHAPKHGPSLRRTLPRQLCVAIITVPLCCGHHHDSAENRLPPVCGMLTEDRDPTCVIRPFERELPLVNNTWELPCAHGRLYDSADTAKGLSRIEGVCSDDHAPFSTTQNIGNHVLELESTPGDAPLIVPGFQKPYPGSGIDRAWRVSIFGYIVGALPQAIRVFGMRGVPLTHTIVGTFSLSFVITEVVRVVAGPAGAVNLRPVPIGLGLVMVTVLAPGTVLKTILETARESPQELAMETVQQERAPVMGRVREKVRAQEKAVEMAQATESARARDKAMAQKKASSESMIPKYTTSKKKMTWLSRSMALSY
jgi:hypothetical protein